ncbi:DUF3987 domain-containing protein [Pseudomonas sp. MMS21-TM103]|uniref:YfjI family protein n=1 Tax=Pseudomonas sp. MMS21 TM103 TaxID=2886506 RepID=UPI001EDE7A67|nr:YfjI family protein [Pseudomonas sp. MMS21 TM103]MCG4453294.1 DUF3987 domain-containing protein [Pseudomonas sp. MMS21 TM103]
MSSHLRFGDQSATWVGVPGYQPPLSGAEAVLPSLTLLPLLNAVIDELQGNIKAPRPLILSTALAAISVAVQGLIDVQKPTGQVVPVSLMLLIIADSGERKSATEKILMNSIRDFQEQQSVQYQKLFRAWDVERSIWESKKKAILRCVTKNVEKGLPSDDEVLRMHEHEMAKPERPKEFKFLYEDATSEAFFYGMYQNLRTAGLISSEGGGVLSGRAFNDLSKQNAIWSGDSITVDRKTSDCFELKDGRLTVSIMVQGAGFKDYMVRRGELARGSGLFARFLVCEPQSTQGIRMENNITRSWEHRDKYNQRMTEVLQQNLGLLEEPDRERKVVKFTAEACERGIQIANTIEVEIRKGGRLHGAGDHASKLFENIARVAAVLHYFEGLDGDISLDTLNIAINLCKWYSDEFVRIFVPSPQDESDAVELMEWLRGRSYGGQRYVLKNHVLQYGPNKIRKKSRLDLALECLCSHRMISLCGLGAKVFIDLKPGLPPEPQFMHGDFIYEYSGSVI